MPAHATLPWLYLASQSPRRRQLLDQLGDPDEHYRPGDVITFPTPDGLGTYAGTVLEVRSNNGDSAVRFDFNHPLAGQPVTFEVHVIGVL